MKIGITLILLLFSRIAFAQYELNDESGIPLIPIDSSFLKSVLSDKKATSIEIFHFLSMDTSKNAPHESVFKCRLDENRRLSFLKGCIHAETNECDKSFDSRIYYNSIGTISSYCTNHYEGGRFLFDSTVYHYSDSSGLLVSSNRYIFTINSADKDTLRGNTYYTYKNGKLYSREIFGYTSTFYPKVVYERNEAGLLNKIIYFNDKGLPEETNNIYYDKYGKIAASASFEKKELMRGDSMKWDKVGRLLEERHFTQDGFSIIIKYKYDKRGRVIEVYFEPSNQEFGAVTTYKYDKSGLMLEKKKATALKVPIYRITYTYDDSGKLIKEVIFNSDNEISAAYRYSYK